MAFFPSNYIIIVLWRLVDRGADPTTPSFLRIYSVGVASLFLLVCGIPTAATWFLRRRWG